MAVGRDRVGAPLWKCATHYAVTAHTHLFSCGPHLRAEAGKERPAGKETLLASRRSPALPSSAPPPPPASPAQRPPRRLGVFPRSRRHPEQPRDRVSFEKAADRAPQLQPRLLPGQVRWLSSSLPVPASGPGPGRRERPKGARPSARPRHSPGSVRGAGLRRVLRSAVPSRASTAPTCTAVLRGGRSGVACEPLGLEARRAGRLWASLSARTPSAFRNLAWRGAVSAAPRRQAEPTGALGQLPPRTRNSPLLLLKNPPERVYVEPCKLPARAFAISWEIGTCAQKTGSRAAQEAASQGVCGGRRSRGDLCSDRSLAYVCTREHECKFQ